MSRSEGMDSGGGIGAEGSDSEGIGGDVVWFLYTGQPTVPRDVTHARIDPSVKVIGRQAFNDYKQLMEVELCEGVVQIEQYAFYRCISLKRFKSPLPSESW